MGTLRAAIASIGWLAGGLASAEAPDAVAHDGAFDPRPDGNAELSVLVLSDISGNASTGCAGDRGRLGSAGTCRPDEGIHAYHAKSFGGVASVASVQFIPSSFASASFIQQQTGIDTKALFSAERWLGENHGVAQTFAVGPWRELTFEGSTFSMRGGRQEHGRPDVLGIDSRSAKLSYSLADNWVLRLSRGAVSGLDHLVAGDDVRRTAVSATYRRSFAEGDWETTLAWGRNSRKFRESVVGYLVESTFRFDGVHTFFGRIEQVGSDEILREDEALQRQLFRMNKLTVGYSQDLRVSSSLRVDAGAFVTRHFVPSGMASPYGSGPTAYMMFVRVKLQ